ncbi:MAG: hypothetical protein WBD59_20445 [Candidatus Sulfotelmatobacter sp.]
MKRPLLFKAKLVQMEGFGMPIGRLLLVYVLSSLISGSISPKLFAQGDGAKEAQVAAADNDLATSKAYAFKACLELRSEMKDPESFTLMQEVAIFRRDKDPKKSSSFRGCIHYIASNSFGGRAQAWGGYHVDNKGRISVYGGEPGEPTDLNHCADPKSRETVADVTAEVTRFLSQK